MLSILPPQGAHAGERDSTTSTTKQRQLLQIRPTHTPACQARMICEASTDTTEAGRRKQSMSSIIKQGCWPLTWLISSIYVCFHVVPKSLKMGDRVTWSHAITISSPDRSVGAGNPACKEEERCCFWIDAPTTNLVFHHLPWVEPSVSSPPLTISKHMLQKKKSTTHFVALSALWYII